MKWIKQGKNQCGQACIAMITGITLEDAIEFCGTKGKTTTKQLIRALQNRNFRCDDKLRRVKFGYNLPHVAILKFTHSDGQSHWVVWHNNKYYDPVAGVFRKVPNWLQESRITSYLEVYE